MSQEPEVCVKNTFLDIRAPAPELRRVATEPGRAPPEGEDEEAAGGGDCNTAGTPVCEVEETPQSDAQGYEADVAPELGTSGPGSMASCSGPSFQARLGSRVVVKNTFLDLDDDFPAIPDLRRVKTEPLPRPDWGEQDSSQGDSAPSEAEGESYRLVTCDSVESSSDWNWGPSAEAPAGRRLEAIGEEDAAAAQMPRSPQPGGFMMVPSTMLMPGVVGMGPIDNLPPGCVAVPVDRHARWPGGLPPPPVAPPSQAPPLLSRVKSPDTPPMGLPSAPELEPGASAAAQPASPATGAGLPPPSPKPQAQDQPVLQRAFSVASAIFRVNWTVAARKLKSKDQFAVSPKFELSFKTTAEFKMVIHPTKISDQKGGKSFLAAKGKGRVELKCETQLDSSTEAIMTYRISVGAGDKRLPPRGPVKHNFSESSVSGLEAEEEEWDFSAVLDEGAQTFVVCLEVLPAGFGTP